MARRSPSPRGRTRGSWRRPPPPAAHELSEKEKGVESVAALHPLFHHPVEEAYASSPSAGDSSGAASAAGASSGAAASGAGASSAGASTVEAASAAAASDASAAASASGSSASPGVRKFGSPPAPNPASGEIRRTYAPDEVMSL